MSVAGGTLSPDKFREAMLDLTANAGVILAIAIALYLLAHHASGGCERRRENPLLKRPDRPIAPD